MALLYWGCGPAARSGDRVFYTADAYHDFILEQQNAVSARMVSLNQLYDVGSPDAIRAGFDSTVMETDRCLFNLQQLTDFEGDTVLRNQACNLFRFYQRIFKGDYRTMLQIFLKGDTASDAEIEKLNAIVRKVGAEEQQLQTALVQTQIQFARKFEFELDSSLVQFR